MPNQRFYDLYTKNDLQTMYTTMTQEELSQKTGFCTRQIYRYLKKWDIEKRTRGRSCPWYALDADDEFMNYFGGFLYADGSLHKTSHTGYSLALILSKKDEHIIDILHSGIKGAGKKFEQTQESGSMVGFKLFGIDLADKLLRFGVTSDKRYGWTRPQITDSMLPHFLRGWYDGDGHIGNKPIMTLTNINEEAIRYFEEMVRYLGYSGSGVKRHSNSGYSRVYMEKRHTMGKLGKNRDVWRHSITGKANCKQMYHLLKGDSALRLDRKWKLLD